MKISFNELTLDRIDDLHAEFLEHLEEIKDNKIILDFENIKKMELPAIQLILSLKKYCDNNDIEFKIENLNTKSIKQTMSLLSLTKILGV